MPVSVGDEAGRAEASQLRKNGTGVGMDEQMTGQPSQFVNVNMPNAAREAYLETLTGVRDPHIHLFVTDAGRKRMRLAQKLYPGTVPRLIARFMHFSARMATAAGEFAQMLILGAGFDTRPIWWPALAGTRAIIVEVDLPPVIAMKRATLAAHDIDYPANIRLVGCDLADPDLLARLQAAGYMPDEPVAVFLEGVTFFLPPKATERLIQPATLRLAAGSRFVFDYWNNQAVVARNAKEAWLGSKVVFKTFPFPDDPAGLTDALAGIGYRDVEITSLAQSVRSRWPAQAFPNLADDWAIVEATRG